VLPPSAEPTPLPTQEDEFLPQWAIAVIVIGLASLLFVIIFGVSVVSSERVCNPLDKLIQRVACPKMFKGLSEQTIYP